MRTIEFKMERQGLVQEGDKVKIIEREGTSSYSYIIDPAVAMSGCFAARYRIKSEYGIVKDYKAAMEDQADVKDINLGITQQVCPEGMQAEAADRSGDVNGENTETDNAEEGI